jgi:hypothetical protein
VKLFLRVSSLDSGDHMIQSCEATFPNHWPEGCPPSTAANCDGEYFHLLRETPPGKEDLRSFAEKGRKLKNVPQCP